MDVISTFNANEISLLKMFYKNSDIYKYVCSSETTKRLLYLDRYCVSLDEYPNVLAHIVRFQEILKERREVQNKRIHYFQLQWPRDKEIFTASKILVPYRSLTNTFAYNSIEWFCRSDCYVVTQKDPSLSLKYLLALLNSKLYYVWLYHRGKRKGNTLELFNTPLSAIPIKQIPSNEQNEFINLVDEIMMRKSENPNSSTSEIEHKIDRLVYALYCLTEEEVSLIENFNV